MLKLLKSTFTISCFGFFLFSCDSDNPTKHGSAQNSIIGRWKLVQTSENYVQQKNDSIIYQETSTSEISNYSDFLNITKDSIESYIVYSECYLHEIASYELSEDTLLQIGVPHVVNSEGFDYHTLFTRNDTLFSTEWELEIVDNIETRATETWYYIPYSSLFPPSNISNIDACTN